MERRDFLKLCSLAGVGIASSQIPGTYIEEAHASPSKFVVMVNAGGGWDHTLVGNPKGDVVNDDGFAINLGFTPDQIGQAGNLIYAPVGYNATFFNQYYQWMTVINGVDCETNSHDTGQQNTWSGRLQQNSPCLAALIAAALGGAKPLAFLTNAGYDSTFGVPISKTRLGDTSVLQDLIFPNRLDPNSEDSVLYHSDDTILRLREFREQRLKAQEAAQRLPSLRDSMALLYTSRLGMDELKKINDYLPEDLGNGMARQANIALAGWLAGLTQTASIGNGGYDTHGPNSDDNQANQTTQLFQGVQALLNRAEELGVIDQLLVIIGSDFGRTPRYNEATGKDHWSVGEVIIIDPGQDMVPGNRLIGATDQFGGYMRLDPNSLTPTTSGGIALKNAHIHKWIRKLMGIEGHEVVKLFPLNVEEDVDLSGPVG